MSNVKVEDGVKSHEDEASVSPPPADPTVKARLSRKRTKTGCLTCRRRRIKCDECKPICRNCHKSKRHCEGYNQRVTYKPADLQYLPHGAATITFHSGLTPSSVSGYGPPSYHQPELRPRVFIPGYGGAFTPQQQPMLQGYGGHYSYPIPDAHMQQVYGPTQQWVAPQQPMQMIAPMVPQPLHPLSSQIQYGPLIAPTVPQAPLESGALDHVYGDTSQASLRTTPESHQSASVPDWGQMNTHISSYPPAAPQLVQSQTNHTTPVSSPEGLPPQMPRVITVSQTQTTTTFTTIQHDNPAAFYAPRPELQRPIDSQTANCSWQSHQTSQPMQQFPDIPEPPEFHAGQLYDVSHPRRRNEKDLLQKNTSTLPARKHTHKSTQGVSENIPNYQGTISSPDATGLLDEAAVEMQDDDYYDINEDDEINLRTNKKVFDQRRQQLMEEVIVRGGLDSSLSYARGFETFLFDGILDTYRPEQVANPLKNPATARIFAHFVTATGPLLTSFVRQTTSPSTLADTGHLPLSQQGLWTYVMPMAALHHQGLLQSILAISSLHIAKLQGASETPSMKHYAYALKRVHHCVGHPAKRLTAPTLAASLLLGYYEILAANHTNWNSHLAGAKQLVTEIDFAGMTGQLQRMKAGSAARNGHGGYRVPKQSPHVDSQSGDPAQEDALLDQIPDVDENDVGLLAGTSLRYAEYGRILECPHDNMQPGQNSQTLDLTKFVTLTDLFWWYCKQDAYQSIISGNPLLMKYTSWTDCPPRAPLNNSQAVHGSFDHLVLVLGRIADFCARDRKRKLEVMEQNGGMWVPPPAMRLSPPGARQPFQSAHQTGAGASQVPSHAGPVPGGHPRPAAPMAFYGMAPPPAKPATMPASYQPFDVASDMPDHREDTDESLGLADATEEALEEWAEIRNALRFFACKLGPGFQPLGPEHQQPVDTPFGPAVFYRSWSISALWAVYYMTLIITIRSHPHMPPAAHMAAGIAASQTREPAEMIGRIFAGMPLPPLSRSLNPNLGAALTEVSVASFFSGVQYQSAEQRSWLVERLFEVDRRAGWASAAAICTGCQVAWGRLAEAGRGPPWKMVTKANARFGSLEPRDSDIPDSIDHDRRFIASRPGARLHFAVGVMGPGEDGSRAERWEEQHTRLGD